jgi:hypothetical protein
LPYKKGIRARGTFVCKYLSFYDPHLKTTFRLPLVHIRVKHGDLSLRTIGLVDSGATASFVPREITDLLGVELPSEIHDSVGAGGLFQTHLCEIDMIEVLKGAQLCSRFEHVKVHIPVKQDAIPYAILGRDSIFWEHDITFRERRQHTILRQPKQA